MPLFRRVAIARGTSSQGSFLPHREISILNGDVDIRAMDAENEQLFWNADAGVYRVVTPAAVTVTGALQGEIHELGTMRVEQTAGAAHAAVSLTSLDAATLDKTSSALLVLATRALNTGAEFDAATNELSKYGAGQAQMEGATFRLTLPAAGADSVRVQALGPDGRPSGWSRTVGVSATGRATITVNTREASTPWYIVSYVRLPTSVDADRPAGVRITHDPLWEVVRVHAEKPYDATLVAMDGSVVRTYRSAGGSSRVSLSGLASGAYVLRVLAGGSYASSVVLHVQP
jgi:hypothetical protein